MKKHRPISDGDYNDILQWLNEDINIKTESLCEEQIMGMRNTFLFQRWQLRKAYYEFRNAMKKTRLGDILISIFEKIFG